LTFLRTSFTLAGDFRQKMTKSTLCALFFAAFYLYWHHNLHILRSFLWLGWTCGYDRMARGGSVDIKVTFVSQQTFTPGLDFRLSPWIPLKLCRKERQFPLSLLSTKTFLFSNLPLIILAKRF
jgi:hypothetical protein